MEAARLVGWIALGAVLVAITSFFARATAIDSADAYMRGLKYEYYLLKNMKMPCGGMLDYGFIVEYRPPASIKTKEGKLCWELLDRQWHWYLTTGV